jgi:hypothetical protein
MKKRLVITLVLIVSSMTGAFAQQTQRLTFTDMRSDGTIIGDVTVNAVFMGWTQQRISIENGMTVTRESVNIYGSNEWSPWEIMRREPPLGPTLRQEYDMILRQYNRTPRAAVRIHLQGGVQAVRIATIPNNASSPMWWSEDGRSFNILNEVWAIVP